MGFVKCRVNPYVLWRGIYISGTEYNRKLKIGTEYNRKLKISMYTKYSSDTKD